MSLTIDRSSTDHRPPSPSSGHSSLIAVLAVAVVVVAAAGLVRVRSGGDGESPLFVMSEAGTVSRLDPDLGEAIFSVEAATVAADGSAVFQAVPSPGDAPETTINQLDLDSGEPTASVTVAGAWDIRTVAPEGGTVALLPPRRLAPGALYEPEPRATTSLLVLRDDGDQLDIELDGNFEPETFSRDEQTLYLLEYVPALAPERYHVRQLDLETREITDVYSPNVELEPTMRGTARDQVISPANDFLYTLYTLGPDAEPLLDPGADAADGGERWAFIHVLSLDEDWSFCIFLPVPIGTDPDPQLALSMSPDGSELFVADRSSEQVVRIDTATHFVEQIIDVPLLRFGRGAPIIAAGLDSTLHLVFDDTGIAVLDTRTEEFGDPLTADAVSRRNAVRDLELSADGRQLRVAMASRVAVFDLDEQVEVAVLDLPDGGASSFVGPPGQSIWPTSLECAC